MNLKSIWVIIAVLAIVIGGYVLLFANAEPSTEVSPTEESGVQTTDMEMSDDSSMTVVTLTDTGFSPESVTIAQGQTVRFVNSSSRGMWVGSDDHPTHTEYDGTSTREHCADGIATNGTFDQCTAGPTGTYWEYTFDKSGTFGYHNHVGASHSGTIIVQ